MLASISPLFPTFVITIFSSPHFFLFTTPTTRNPPSPWSALPPPLPAAPRPHVAALITWIHGSVGLPWCPRPPLASSSSPMSPRTPQKHSKSRIGKSQHCAPLLLRAVLATITHPAKLGGFETSFGSPRGFVLVLTRGLPRDLSGSPAGRVGWSPEPGAGGVAPGRPARHRLRVPLLHDRPAGPPGGRLVCVCV